MQREDGWWVGGGEGGGRGRALNQSPAASWQRLHLICLSCHQVRQSANRVLLITQHLLTGDVNEADAALAVVLALQYGLEAAAHGTVAIIQVLGLPAEQRETEWWIPREHSGSALQGSAQRQMAGLCPVLQGMRP